MLAALALLNAPQLNVGVRLQHTAKSEWMMIGLSRVDDSERSSDHRSGATRCAVGTRAKGGRIRRRSGG